MGLPAWYFSSERERPNCKPSSGASIIGRPNFAKSHFSHCGGIAVSLLALPGMEYLRFIGSPSNFPGRQALIVVSAQVPTPKGKEIKGVPRDRVRRNSSTESQGCCQRPDSRP